jgi:four helix bundle protein
VEADDGKGPRDRSYRSLRVWQASTDLAVAAYRTTEAWPPDERYGMTSQVRRAGVSVAANIAEGWGRQSQAEFVRFLLIANGSLKELETLMEVANRVGFASASSKDAIQASCADVGRQILALIANIKRKSGSVVREEAAVYSPDMDADPDWFELGQEGFC